MKILRAVLIISLLFWTVNGFAETVVEPASTQNWFDRSHDYVSEWIETIGIGIDQFLSRSREINENESYIRLSTAYVFDSLGREYFEPDINAKLDLPGTQKKLKLVFDNDPEEAEALYQQDTELNAARDRNKNHQSSAALRWLLPIWQSWRPTVDLGIRATIPLDPFVRMKIRKSYALPNAWHFYTEHRLAFYHSKGLIEKSYFTFARPINAKLLWLNTFQWQWKRQERYLEYGYILAFNHFISAKDRIIWRVAAYYQERPVARQEAYILNMRYRRDLYKNWLFFEVVPALSFTYQTGFRDQYGLTLRLEVLFKANGEDK